ncbi:MAG: ketopantoate reductase family protein [Promethearchaeota archaeon]
MNIVIYGTGAIGSVLASLISISEQFIANKHDIYLVGREYILNQIRENGLIYIPYLSDKNQDSSAPLKYEIKLEDFLLFSDINNIPKADVVFLTMKAYSLENSLKNAEKWLKKNNPYIIIAMNGLGIKEIVENYVPSEKIIELSVGYPSKLEGNKVTNTGGNSFFAAPKNDKTIDILSKIFGLKNQNFEIQDKYKKYFSKNFKPIRFFEDFKLMQWKKGIANIAMNGISAISMLTVGEVLERKTMHCIIKKLINEAIEVAKHENIIFNEDMYQWLMSFAGKDPHHKTSTLQDIIKDKPTEIPFINGYIVRKGIQYGVDITANRAIYDLIAIIEAENNKKTNKG